MRNSFFRNGLALGILLFFVTTSIVSALNANPISNSISAKGGSWLYVGGSGSGNYTRIQDAIDNASNGDTIYVFNGTYFENLYIHITINLIGENKNQTIIDGNRSNGDTVCLNSDGIILSGFTIKNSGKQKGDSGIRIDSNFNVIRENIIIDNGWIRYFYNQGGIFINESSYNTIENNIITENLEAGIYLVKADNNIIKNNIIYNNGYLAIIANASSYNKIIKNDVYKNYCGMTFWPYSTHNIIEKNSIHDHPGCGIAFKAYSDNNIIRNNQLINNLEWGIMLGFGPTKNNLIEYNTILGTLGGTQNWFDGSGLVLSIAYNNKIRFNNFIGNKNDVYLENSLFNFWRSNYWENYTGKGVKFIQGHFAKPYIYHPEFKIPWFAIDWNPAEYPNEIETKIITGPYTQNVSKDSITILWETNFPTVDNYIIYGNETREYTKEGINDISHHEITISPLFSSGYYIIKSDDYESKKYNFILEKHSEKTKQFKCIIIGDSRGTWDTWRNASLIADTVNLENPEIVIHGGDMVDKGNDLGQWKDWLAFMRPLMQNSTLFAVIGNHELNNKRFYEIFALPNNEKWYSFDYGPCHFIVLNNYEPWWIGTEQYEWLESDLQSNKKIFTIICFHEPIYCSGGHSPRNDIKEIWEPLFNNYTIDLVFQSHCHFYQRTIPINNTIYIVSGGAGAPLYSPQNASFINCSKKDFHYCMIDVSLDNNELKFYAKDANGKIFDEFIIKK